MYLVATIRIFLPVSLNRLTTPIFQSSHDDLVYSLYVASEQISVEYVTIPKDQARQVPSQFLTSWKKNTYNRGSADAQWSNCCDVKADQAAMEMQRSLK